MMVTGAPRYTHFEVSEGVVWTKRWWQSATGVWYELVRTADVKEFTRAEADFYIVLGNINDVPTS